MRLKLYQVDAFTDRLFGGNPAAVCSLQTWLPDALMQQIANENNLSETAFFAPEGDDLRIRWFTPVVEVDLCGHATIASAHVLFHHLNYQKPGIRFHSRSGWLSVRKDGDWLTMNFPLDELTEVETPAILFDAFNLKPVRTFKGRENYLTVLHNEKEVEQLKPDFNLLLQLKSLGVIVTAKGTDVDFVSRFFAPYAGINEDPVTGSAHTSLTAYWANELRKQTLTARQLSKRGGYIKCKLVNDRVEISGQAVTYLTGEMVLPDVGTAV